MLWGTSTLRSAPIVFYNFECFMRAKNRHIFNYIIKKPKTAIAYYLHIVYNDMVRALARFVCVPVLRIHYVSK